MRNGDRNLLRSVTSEAMEENDLSSLPDASIRADLAAAACVENLDAVFASSGWDDAAMLSLRCRLARLDLALLRAIALARPDWQLAFAGSEWDAQRITVVSSAIFKNGFE